MSLVVDTAEAHKAASEALSTAASIRSVTLNAPQGTGRSAAACSSFTTALQESIAAAGKQVETFASGMDTAIKTFTQVDTTHQGQFSSTYTQQP